MKYTDLISGGHNTSITYKELRHYLGSVLQSYLPNVSENTNYQFNLLNGENTFVLSLQNNLGVSNTSNTLKYTKSVSNVYVKLVERNLNNINLPLKCNGETFSGGLMRKADYYAEFYSDAGGTTPLNVTGLGLVVNVRTIKTDYILSAVLNENYNINCSGIEILLFDYLIKEETRINCEKEVEINIETEVSILNGNYTII